MTIRHGLVALVVLFLTTLSSAAFAQCGVTMSCTDTKPLPRCEFEGCFISQEAKQQFERDNKCVAQNKCTYAVNRVTGELNKIPSSDPTQGFYRNQECIANKACSSKASLDSGKWLDEVVYSFVMPLIDERGEWKRIKAQCMEYSIAAALRCQNLMAEYHIGVDLQGSLNQNGCGSEHDWDLVGEWLAECVAKGVESDIVPGFQWIAAQIAGRIVKGERDKVRNQCVDYRRARGLPIEESTP